MSPSAKNAMACLSPASVVGSFALSRQPFLDSARVLLAEGVPPQTRLTMRHVGSSTDSLTATVGAAAKLTVDESRPRFVKWQAWSPPERACGRDGGVQDALEAAAG
jgi:hypothetical protein